MLTKPILKVENLQVAAPFLSPAGRMTTEMLENRTSEHLCTQSRYAPE